MIHLASCVPDYTLVCKLLKHQGLCLNYLKLYEGAKVAFQKMREAAEEANDRINEMKAYHLLGNCL